MRFLEWLKNLFGKRTVMGWVPRPQDPNILGAGKTFICDGEVSVVADKIFGNKADTKKFEIWGTNNEQETISMLEFYCQLEGRRPTKEEVDDWNFIEVLEVEPLEKKSTDEKEETIH